MSRPEPYPASAINSMCTHLEAQVATMISKVDLTIQTSVVPLNNLKDHLNNTLRELKQLKALVLPKPFEGAFMTGSNDVAMPPSGVPSTPSPMKPNFTVVPGAPKRVFKHVARHAVSNVDVVRDVSMNFLVPPGDEEEEEEKAWNDALETTEDVVPLQPSRPSSKKRRIEEEAEEVDDGDLIPLGQEDPKENIKDTKKTRSLKTSQEKDGDYIDESSDSESTDSSETCVSSHSSNSSESEEEQEEEKAFTKDGYPADWFSAKIQGNHAFPEKESFLHKIRSIAFFGPNASSSGAAATHRSRELWGRMAATGIRIRMSMNAATHVSRNKKGNQVCALCGTCKNLGASVFFPKLRKDVIERTAETLKTWCYVDIYPTNAWDTVFGMYAYWPEAWTYFNQFEQDRVWVGVGTNCAAKLCVLQQLVKAMTSSRESGARATKVYLPEIFRSFDWYDAEYKLHALVDKFLMASTVFGRGVTIKERSEAMNEFIARQLECPRLVGSKLIAPLYKSHDDSGDDESHEIIID